MKKLKLIFIVTLILICKFVIGSDSVDVSVDQVTLNNNNGKINNSGDKQFKALVIDMDYILQNAKEARQIKMRLDELKVKVQKEILNLETKLRQQYARLHSSSKKHREYDDRKHNFIKQNKKIRELVQNKRNLLKNVYFEAMEKFRKKVNSILLSYIKAGDYNLILKRQAIVYCNGDLDKTDELLGLVNAAYSPVKIELK